MKGHILLPAAITLLLTSFVANAAGSSKQPVATRFAQTQSHTSFELSASSFSDVELDEADKFDGQSAAFDLTVPISDQGQLRLFVPFYTDGDAQFKSSGLSTDIEGNGGVFDFATLQYEHEISNANESDDITAFTIGAGPRTAKLKTRFGDYYNHNGRILLLGVKRDTKIFNGETPLLINAGIRYYFQSDDLHPDGKQSWVWADIKTAVIFEPWGGYVVPVLELTYLGDFSDYNSLSVMPELIFPLGDSVSFKLAGILGLTKDGSQAGATGSLSIDF